MAVKETLYKKIYDSLKKHSIPNIHGKQYPNIIDNTKIDYLSEELTKAIVTDKDLIIVETNNKFKDV